MVPNECEYPPCTKPGEPRYATNMFEQGEGRRYVLELCDEHYEKLRNSDPDLVDWLITRIWP